jgi:hypothetical protein
MKFSHRDDERGDRLGDVLSEKQNGLRLIISRVGAQFLN